MRCSTFDGGVKRAFCKEYFYKHGNRLTARRFLRTLRQQLNRVPA